MNLIGPIGTVYSQKNVPVYLSHEVPEGYMQLQVLLKAFTNLNPGFLYLLFESYEIFGAVYRPVSDFKLVMDEGWDLVGKERRTVGRWLL